MRQLGIITSMTPPTVLLDGATTGSPAQPFSIDFKANGVPDPEFAGAFRATATRAIPAGATGSGSALLEGRPNVRMDTNGDGVLENVAVPVVSAGRAFAITERSTGSAPLWVARAACSFAKTGGSFGIGFFERLDDGLDGLGP